MIGGSKVANISWFVKTGDQIARVEEALVSIDDKSLTFTRDNIKFQLVSDFSLKVFLHGDVLFLLQDKGGKLIPFVLPETLSQLDVLLVGNSDNATFKPGLLKELIAQRTEKLKKHLSDFQDLIRFLLKQKAEKDLQSLDFIKDIQTFQDTVYEEFLKILEQNIANVAQTKGFLLKASPKPPPPLIPTPQTPSLSQPNGAGNPALSQVPPITTSPEIPATPSAPLPPIVPVSEVKVANPIIPEQINSSPQLNTDNPAPGLPTIPILPPSKNINDQIRSLFQ